MATLATRIKELRQSENMTQTEFGNKFGIVKSTVSLYESGKSTPDDEIKISIAKYFKVSMDYLMGLSDIRNPYANTNEVEEEDFDPLTVDIDIAAHNEGEFTEAQLKQLKELIKKYGK